MTFSILTDWLDESSSKSLCPVITGTSEYIDGTRRRKLLAPVLPISMLGSSLLASFPDGLCERYDLPMI